MLSVLLLVAFYSCALWCYEDDMAEAFKLHPNETTIFTGHSLTGCSIEEKVGDDYRVMWLSASSVFFSLIRLMELDRLGYLRQVKRVVTCVGYQLVHESTDKELAASNRMIFPMTWRHLHYLPFSSVCSPTYLNIHDWVKNPLETPPESGKSIVSRASEYARLFPMVVEQACTDKEINMCYERHVFAFTEIVKLCRKYGIEFVVVFSPHLSWVREHHWARDRFKVYEDLFREIGIRYIDCRDWVADEYFRDTKHLLPEGAKVFTPMILKELSRQDIP